MLILFIIVAVIAVIAFIGSGSGGAKGMVSVIFGKYLTYKQTIQFNNDGSCELKGGLVFQNQKQAKLFILNLIFLWRIKEKERSSRRCQLEIDTIGKAEKFFYSVNGKENWAHLYNFETLGELITTIWYIESGLRASYFFGEYYSLDTMYDEFSSKVITREYKRLCSLHNIDEIEGLI